MKYKLLVVIDCYSWVIGEAGVFICKIGIIIMTAIFGRYWKWTLFMLAGIIRICRDRRNANVGFDFAKREGEGVQIQTTRESC